MKKLAPQLSLLFIIVFNTSLISQNGWNWQHPDPQGNTLQSVSYCDGVNGFSVGNWGRIIHTSDGGTSWTAQTGGSSENLNQVSFMDNNNGIITGDNGLILRTIDGGTNWFEQCSGFYYDLHGASLASTNQGHVVGDYGTILNNENAAAVCTYENISICEGDTYLDWFQSGAYSRTLTSSVGADSIVSTFLVLNPVPDQATINMVQDTLISTAVYGNQWDLNSDNKWTRNKRW